MKAQRRAQEKYERDRDSELYLERQEGIKEGEKQNTIKSAKKMLSAGLSIDIVSKYTGLSIDEIKKLV